MLKVKKRKPERRHENVGVSGVFIFNFEHISNLFLMFQLLTLTRQMSAGISLQDKMSET